MLRKSKKSLNDAESVELSSTNTNLEKTRPPASSASKQAQKTMIGEEISIKGTIHGRGDLVIQGSIQGNIVLDQHHLTIGPNGKVEAEVAAENVTISGRLKGNITANGKVEITKSADFNGEIKAKRISVEDGAFLKAVIELQRNSPAASTPKPVPSVSKDTGKKATAP